MNVDTSKWSGEGEFTQTVVDSLSALAEVAAVWVEDSPATRSDADYNFISNEVFVAFGVRERVERGRVLGVIPVTRSVPEKAMTLSQLETALVRNAQVGGPDYADDGMLQYLRAERVVPPYQTRGYKIVELVRIYEVEAGQTPADHASRTNVRP